MENENENEYQPQPHPYPYYGNQYGYHGYGGPQGYGRKAPKLPQWAQPSYNPQPMQYGTFNW